MQQRAQCSLIVTRTVEQIASDRLTAYIYMSGVFRGNRTLLGFTFGFKEMVFYVSEYLNILKFDYPMFVIVIYS